MDIKRIYNFSFNTFSQEKFKLKIPSIDSLKLIKNNDLENQDIIFLYLETNYKSTSKKYDIKKDKVFENNPECAFKKNYEFNILFESFECGEAKPLKQTIILPKSKNTILRKLIENIYKADLYDNTEPINKWNNEKNEFTPGENEAGCYYKIFQSNNNSKIEVICGC